MLTKLFGFNPQTTTVKTEILAGITTFLTMAYILAVNPNILSDTGMNKDAVFTSTIVASILATCIMAFLAKLPFALGPGMGLNAFFAYTICMKLGYSWQFALAAVLIEGLIFIFLTLTNLREAIVNSIPLILKNAISVGIGLFIAFIGLQSSGIIVNSDATLVSLGDVTSGSALLACIGVILTAVLMIKNVKGALLIGILVTTLVGIPMGITQFNGVMSMPPSIEPVFMKFDFSHVLSVDMFMAVLTLLFVDMFDTIGTLVGVCTKSGMLQDGKIPHAKKAFMADAIGTTAGAMLGTSTVTTFVESASGVGEGGRSGLTSFTTAVCFFLSLFFAPLFLSIPPAATAPVLILVGLMMMTPIRDVDLTNYSDAIPAFICIIVMPLAYSISDGVLLGLISYVLVNVLVGNFYKLTPSIYVLSALFVLKYLL